ncbi:Hypothetical protein A7982_04162 [Minicystis rosea]|nr:Hypothetical protein A7982_04162 [Minicystis rosea]
MSYGKKVSFASLALAAVFAVGCGDNSTVLDDAAREQQAVLGMKEAIQTHIEELDAAVKELQAAVPTPDDDGWNSTDDKAAVEAMRTAWKKARLAYETIEGPLAVVFPELDYTLDARYDAFIETAPDDNLFDDTGATGLHSVERIIWSDVTPQSVITFESGLPNYKAAAFPSNLTEATDFRDKLVARAVSDVGQMRDKWKALALEAPSAYQGVMGSMEEQHEKVVKAATGEEESRYAQYTLADMRANVAGGKATYALFHDWILTKEGGDAVDQAVAAGFAKLDEAYAGVSGDSLPSVPEGWSSENPTAEQLATPFGKLYSLVSAQSDASSSDSLVSAMTQAETILGAWTP